MNEKQKRAAAKKDATKAEIIRQQYWPEVADGELWDRKRCVGFATMPRPMPQIMALIDALGPKGKPASQAYFALWCRLFDGMLLKIQTPGYLARESGFGGERATSTWQGRMQTLVDLGFIKAAPGDAGPFEHILVLNPYRVLYRLNKAGQLASPALSALYAALMLRAVDIGARDLDELEEEERLAAEAAAKEVAKPAKKKKGA